MGRWLLLCSLLALAMPGRAHLCNDVFAQARDNLAVKVDIRDGQLRINQEASFRVYLLNTMDRGIADIRLEVVSKDFTATVQPAPEWKDFPQLRTCLQGGKKEFFTVTLARKGETADGKYDIGLRLFNGQNAKMEFKTIDLADAMAVVKVPASPATLKVDGNVQKTDWADSILCSNLQNEVKQGKFMVKVAAESPSRVRFLADAQNLYALVNCADVGANDKLNFYVATNADAKPTKISVDLTTGALQDAPPGAASVASAGGIEIQLPLRALNLGKTFCLNIAREKDGVLSVWRGTPSSISNPIVYATIITGE